MSSTTSPSLHRFVPRRALETTAYGYEVVSQPVTVEECVQTVHWIDCWCPDAVQFVLMEASNDLSPSTCSALLEAIDRSHLAQKIRLVCKASSLADDALLDILRERNLGLLLDHDDDVDLQRLTEKGILGIRLGAEALAGSGQGAKTSRARTVVRAAHDLGLRSVASQISSPEHVRSLLAIGFDYVSQRSLGFVPMKSGSEWHLRPWGSLAR
jgi:hypothetical protein